MILVLVFCITFSLCDVLCRAIRLIFELVIAFSLIDVTSRLRCCIVFAVVVALFLCACTDQCYRRNGFIVILHACFLVDGGISVAHICIVSVVFRQPFFFLQSFWGTGPSLLSTLKSLDSSTIVFCFNSRVHETFLDAPSWLRRSISLLDCTGNPINASAHFIVNLSFFLYCPRHECDVKKTNYTGLSWHLRSKNVFPLSSELKYFPMQEIVLHNAT